MKGIETERGYKECQADDGTQDGQCIRTDKESPGSLGATGASALCVVGALGCCRRDSKRSVRMVVPHLSQGTRVLSTRAGSALSRCAFRVP